MTPRTRGVRGGEGGGVAPAAGDARAVTRLLKSVVTIVGSGATVEEAMLWALDLVCGYTGWPLGHIYTAADDGDVLRPASIWHDDDPARYRRFVEMTMAMPLAPGADLPGRILQSGRPAWVIDVAADANFPRAGAALEAGIGAGVGFPIISGRGIEGVMEFFAPGALEPDADLLELLSHVGLQVGHLIDRARARQELRESEARLRELVELAPDALIGADAAGAITLVNDEAERLTGYRREELLGKPVELLVPDRLRGAHDGHRAQYAAAPRRRAMGAGRELAVRRKDGTEVPADISLSPLGSDEGAVVLVALRDVTERRRAELARRQAEDRRRRAQEELEDQQAVLERIVLGEPVTTTLETLCRRVESEYHGTRCSVLLVDPDEEVLRHAAAPSLPVSFREAIDGLKIGEGQASCGAAAARGERVVVSDALTDPLTVDYVELALAHGLRAVWSHPLKNASGQVIGTFAVYRSEPQEPSEDEIRTVTTAGNVAALAIERSLAEEALSTAARADSLTGLPNRARVLELIESELDRSGQSTAVMFLDLDRFKLINDGLGHPAGDRVLLEVASRLTEAAEGRGVVARFGGDEFTILIPSATDESIRALADRVEETLAAPFVLDGGEFFLTASLGIARNDHVTDAYGLVRDADAAMFAAKERGSGRRAEFDAGLRERIVERVTLEAELRRAIERDEFVMHYQPILDVSGSRWAGAEGLVRWRHPEHGLLNPERFIPLAEETGLIVPLGAKILELVAAQAAEWAEELPWACTTANVCPLQLADPSFVDNVARTLHRYDLSGEQLCIEITESSAMEELEAAQTTLEQIAALGIDVMIDDFGTGHSSLARLGDLPIAGVKIDRRFTARLGTDESADSVLQAVTTLAHAHGLRVVAEGIENSRALAIAGEMGCEYAQGRHVSHPAPAEEVTEVLSAPPRR